MREMRQKLSEKSNETDMIQILLDSGSEYSRAELAQMAIEAGYEWLIMPDDSPERLRDELPDISALCREAGVILTIADNVAACREYGLHGVFLHKGADPAAVRNDLGAEAIIGAEIASAATATVLARADIDYFALEPTDAAVIAEARKAGVDKHFVAITDNKETTETLLAEGFSGFIIPAARCLTL